MVRFLMRIFSSGPEPEARPKPSPPKSEREEILFYLQKYRRELRELELRGSIFAQDMRDRIRWYERSLSAFDSRSAA